MKSRFIYLTGAVLMSWLVAGPAGAGVILDGASDQGYLDLGASAPYASVGQVKGVTPDFNFSASGTLIAANWVLTAAHVVDQATSLNFKFGGQSFAASAWYAFPKWDGNLGGGYDIGLMKFDIDLSAATGIAPASRYTGTDEFGRVGTSVGFGMTGTGSTGATTFDQKKRAGQNMIDAVLLTPGRTNRVLLSDFDELGDPTESSFGSLVPLALEYLIAPGDSGGGLFIDIAGIPHLAGVHSFGWGRLDGDPNSDYGDVSGHTRVTYFNSWINEFLGSVSGGGTGSGGNGRNKKNLTGASAFSVAEVPEPGLVGVLTLGLAVIALSRRRMVAVARSRAI